MINLWKLQVWLQSTTKLVDCEVAIYSDIVPDPSVEVIASGIQKLQSCNAEVMIALGGGSSIDGAKAMREYAKKLLEEFPL